MKNIENLEIIELFTVDGKLTAMLSYQNLDEIDNINNGYNIVNVPVNIRELKRSIRGNILVNQSIQPTDLIGTNDTR